MAKRLSAEQQRLEEARELAACRGKKWGPYLSERQWGTVREDYSAAGNAWDYFSHDQARSRAYRWGCASAKQRTCCRRNARGIIRHFLARAVGVTFDFFSRCISSPAGGR
jgi:hypothetical protein